MRITLLIKNQQTTTTLDLFTSFRIRVKNEINYIISHTEDNNPYQGFSNLLLVPYGSTETKNKLYYSCKLYGIESNVEKFYPDHSKFKLLGNYEAVLPGKEKPEPKTFIDRINTFGIVTIWLFVLFTLVYYMEYRSARTAYTISTYFLEKKILYKIEKNMKYAIQKDASFSKAHLLSAKIALYIGSNEVCIENCNLVSPRNAAERLTQNYLLGRSNYAMKNYDISEFYFDKILNDLETRDSVAYYKSKLLIQKKEYSKAYDLLDKTFPATKNDSINLMKLKYLVKSENYSKAKTVLCNDLVKSGNNLPIYYFYSGCVALGMSDTITACEYFLESEKLKYPHAQAIWGIHCYSRNVDKDSLAF